MAIGAEVIGMPCVDGSTQEISPDPGDDLLDVIEDVEGSVTGSEIDQLSAAAWLVLIVDDDKEVHASTSFALAGVEILGRRLELLHAYSAADAIEVLTGHGRDVAVVLLDVVMETEDAGLKAVRVIREGLGLANLRIILRTGQPGYAPELAVIKDYDINDYRTKPELTRSRLISCLHTALRAFGHLKTLEANRSGLEMIVRGSADLFARRSLKTFCEGVLIQIAALLETERHGIVLVRLATADPTDFAQDGIILAAAGPYSDLVGEAIGHIPDPDLHELLREALNDKCSVFRKNKTVLHISGPRGDDMAVFIATGRELGQLDRQLLEVFCTNIAVGFDNIGLLDHIRTLAFFDPLTGLPNRTQFQAEIDLRLRRMRAEPSRSRLAVVEIDIDQFQVINDGLGHETGDCVLIKVAKDLTQAFPEPGALCRLGGDHYGILADVMTPADEIALAARIRACFAHPQQIGGTTLSISASGGYALANADETDIPLVIRRAGMALKLAKRKRRGEIVPYSGAMADELKNRLLLVREISEARRGSQFQLHYQPQLKLADKTVFGAEALLRWIRPDGVYVRPDVFIPAAEDAGHIVWIGDWVLREACLRQVAWRDHGFPSLQIAVNVSVRQLHERDFIPSVVSILEATGCDPRLIELEITETNAMEGEAVLASLRSLRDLGFRIAIDDFGTGHSSLARLRQLPVTLLKIDRSFVDGIEQRADIRSIASMIVRMGHELGIAVLAEGVETEAQEAVLRDCGCDLAQGYLYARPLPASDLTVWLNRRQAAGRDLGVLPV